jgi:peptide/nickel transport system substrate-binding protein
MTTIFFRRKFFKASVGLSLALSAGLSSATAEQPVRGGTLVTPIHWGEPATFDCAAAGSAGVVMRIAPHYSSLLKLNPESYPEVKSDLAKSWAVSADGLTYQFKLHPNIKFHDGTALTATDVKVSYDRLRNPPAGVVSLRKSMFEDIKSIEAPDASTLVIKLSAPNAAMLQLLAMPYACVYSAKLLASDPTYPAKKVMGSGPFKFTRYVAGSEWVGERFDGYFKAGQPYLDGFRALSVTPSAAVNGLMAGQAHYSLRSLTDNEIDRIVAARGKDVKVVGRETTTPVRMWVSINTQKPPFNDARVRRALVLAVDQWNGGKAMSKITGVNVVGGFVRPGSPFARTNHELATQTGYSRDVAAARKEARRLLAEAGHPNLKLVFSNHQAFPYFGVFMVDQLRQIGVTVEHQMGDATTQTARKKSGNYDLIFDNPPEYLDDPTVQLSPFQMFKINPSNSARVDDEKMEALYDAQKREMDPAKRRLRVQELESYILDQGYVIPLFWQNWTRVISSDVGGLGEMPSNFLKMDLADVWLRSGGKP